MAKELEQHECPQCHKVFWTKFAHKKFCSSECRDKYDYERHHLRSINWPETRKCLNCEKDFFSFSAQRKFCCKECGNEYRKKLKQPKVKTKTLDDWIREANECNLDYGNYRALIEMGKTYEELKATADNRLMIGHARRHKIG